MKTIALIEPNSGGHHLTYLQLFSKTLLDLGCRVMAFSSESDTLTDWANVHTNKARHLHAFQITKPLPPKLPGLGRVRRLPVLGHVPQPIGIVSKWNHTAELIRQAAQQIGISPNLVFLNWLDSYFSHYLTHHLVDQVFPYPWAGLYFRPGALRFQRRSLLKSPFPHCAIARSPRCHGVGILDEGLTSNLHQVIGNPVIPFPDFADESPPDPGYELVQQILDKAGKRKIIGLFGALSKRKGLVTLLRAAQQSHHKDWFFVFAGSLSASRFHQDYSQRFPEEYDWVQSVVAARPDNCFFHLERIPQESQFNALINACDALFAAYENFPYSSNILAKAAAFKKPVITSEGFCMGRRVEQFEIGLTIPQGDVYQSIMALQKLFDHPEKLSLRFDFAGYQSLHSTQRLNTIFVDLMNSL